MDCDYGNRVPQNFVYQDIIVLEIVKKRRYIFVASPHPIKTLKNFVLLDMKLLDDTSRDTENI